MNTNLIHNILNAGVVAIPALSAFDFTPLLGPEMSLKIVAGLGLAKILINAWRDGPSGMVKPQPPVKK